MSAPDGHDVIVVGSGAGGGPLAARLALEGFSVLLLEAGDDHQCPYYDVPVFHAHASEDRDMRWDFFVHHYDDPGQRGRDPKLTAEHDGVLYPRGGTLGGSTATSAMIVMAPHPGDWDAIAATTGDESWTAERMWPYFQRLERWSPPPASDGTVTAVDPAAGHGSDGWLATTRAAPAIAGREPQWLDVLAALEAESDADAAGADAVPLDPNDRRNLAAGAEGMAFIPVAVDDGRRNGSRERVLDAVTRSGGRLELRLNAFVTRVRFEGTRAVGVEYVQGAGRYGADPRDGDGADATPHYAAARREVVLSAGAFNTPQLLQLSGVGPAADLRALGIDVVHDLPGVGRNLQDRYEVTVVDAMREPFGIFDGATFDIPTGDDDPLFEQWRRQDGPYTTNGSLAAYVHRSTVAGAEPDLIVFALPVAFTGYYPGYSRDFIQRTDRLTFVVLKAHTENRGGAVTLRSADPFQAPAIAFRYFEEGTPGDDRDLRAVAEGVGLARALAARAAGRIDHEVQPGAGVEGEALRQWIRDSAWGHHASCSCPIGADDDPGAVLDSRFRVRGVQGLRVVDASVFPRIPGFFIASAVYMVGEKAADVIAADLAAD